MRITLLILSFSFSFFYKAESQREDSLSCPKVNVTISLIKDTFRIDDNISLQITLTNNTKSIQSVWFDRPKSTTGEPAWTFVSLKNIKLESPF